MDAAPTANPAFPLWARSFATVGLLWSLFGAFQFASQTFSNREELVAAGMTSAQAVLYSGLPVWMDIVFGLGTIGGSIGCILLLAKRRQAMPVLAISLAAYGALYVGDIAYGVFAAFGPPQVVVLSLVVVIAAGLWWLARQLDRRGLLA